MIVYKWVYKKDNKYYSLMNYGYTRLSKEFLLNQPPYEINKTYNNYQKEGKNLKLQFKQTRNIITSWIKEGFYFWTKLIPININAKIKMRQLGADINAILECNIKKKNILSYERGTACIRAKGFKIIKEI